MKRPPKHILLGFLAAAAIFLVVCGVLKATLSTSTFQVVNAIWLAGVLLTWLVWSFRGQYQVRRYRAAPRSAPTRREGSQASANR
jgi:MFS superfamily sulfate permease-like transporter